MRKIGPRGRTSRICLCRSAYVWKTQNILIWTTDNVSYHLINVLYVWYMYLSKYICHNVVSKISLTRFPCVIGLCIEIEALRFGVSPTCDPLGEEFWNVISCVMRRKTPTPGGCIVTLQQPGSMADQGEWGLYLSLVGWRVRLKFITLWVGGMKGLKDKETKGKREIPTLFIYLECVKATSLSLCPCYVMS